MTNRYNRDVVFGTRAISNVEQKSPVAQGLTRRSFLKAGIAALVLTGTPGTGRGEQCPSVWTPRQTRGPFFPYDRAVSVPIREDQVTPGPLVDANDQDLTRIKGKSGIAMGQVVYFQGQLWSPKPPKSDFCQPIVGASIVLWQANFSGRYNHRDDVSEQQRHFFHPVTGAVIERVHDKHFQYWGKAMTDERGKFQFKTILPGFYPAADDWYRPPHLHFSIRVNDRPEFVTQTYFSGHDLPESNLIAELNKKDWILRDSRIDPKQQEHLIVEYRKDPAGILTDGLVGSCQFFLAS